MELSLENQELTVEQKLAAIVRHAPIGIAEVDNKGKIINLNLKVETILRPIFTATGVNSHNFYGILEYIAPSLIDRIKNYTEQRGHIVANETHGFTLPGIENKDIHFLFTID